LPDLVARLSAGKWSLETDTEMQAAAARPGRSRAWSLDPRVLGFTAGLAIAYDAAGPMTSPVVLVNPHDPGTFGVPLAVVGGVAPLASDPGAPPALMRSLP
jgi:hypothetical protein